MSYLVGICIYPIKSLDRVVVTKANLLPSGALVHDREFAIVDRQGNFVNGKRTDKVHLLRSQFDLEQRTVTLNIQGSDQRHVFHLDHEREAIAAWLSRYFGFPVQLVQNATAGFPDDTNAPGPTVISTGTLEAVAAWFPGLTLNKMRLRLRTNLEIGGVPAFWEDQLFAESNCVVQFQIGEVVLEGVNPCQRCIVPARDELTGHPNPGFQKTFVAKRRDTLPEWAIPGRFNHFYRLAVNTQIPASQAGKVLQAGDEVKLLGIRKIHLS